jgi:hypothetical protein
MVQLHQTDNERSSFLQLISAGTRKSIHLLVSNDDIIHDNAVVQLGLRSNATICAKGGLLESDRFVGQVNVFTNHTGLFL